MATKTRTPNKAIKPFAELAPEPWEYRWGRRVQLLVVLGLLVLFWYRTNSWPIAGVVNYKPIWGWELNNLLYNQGGAQALDNLITEQLIKDEIASHKITIADSDVDAKIADIKKQIGSDDSFKQALAMQGMSEGQLREQIKLQLGLEKLVEPSTDSAKIQQEVYAKVQDLRTKGKVWKMPRVK